MESVHLVSFEQSLAFSFFITGQGNLTNDKSLKIAPNGPRLHKRDKYTKPNVGQFYFIIHNNKFTMIYF